MKRLVVLFLMLVFLSCQNNSLSNKDEIVVNISYIKDENTGLCFATVNSLTYGFYSIVSISCVPCDSIKNLK